MFLSIGAIGSAMVKISVGPYVDGSIVEGLYPPSQRIPTYLIADSNVPPPPIFTLLLPIPHVPYFWSYSLSNGHKFNFPILLIQFLFLAYSSLLTVSFLPIKYCHFILFSYPN